MELLVQSTDIAAAPADLLVLALSQNQKSPVLAAQIKTEGFQGKLLETATLHSPVGITAKKALVVGLGEAKSVSPVTIRQAAAKAVQVARSLKTKTLALAFPQPEQYSQAIAEGLLLGGYQFRKYKTQPPDKEPVALESVTLLTTDKGHRTAVMQGLAKGEAIATAILNARDITNEPPSKIKPVHLAQAATEIASLSNHISATILDEAALTREGYNALLAVAAGSEEEPFLIHLHYQPALTKGARADDSGKPSIAFVGKGVTFDSGGLGIKPWNAMRSMKTDMAGGATVLGIFQAIAELEALGLAPALEVHGIIAATENMISGQAMRPDDIIETKSGKTIEILHTDAEGRLVLSDALTYAVFQKPDYMIDFATLTGSAVKALGRDYSAAMGNNQQLLALVEQASQETGELTWPLPLPEIYKKQLESPVADLQNISPSPDSPGAIFGGLFLQEFVGQTPWVHLDIAGPAFQEEDTNPVYPKGATGYGILLSLRVLELLESAS